MASPSLPEPPHAPPPASSKTKVKTTWPTIPPNIDRTPIRTERLLLRPYTAADADEVYGIRQQPEVMIWTRAGTVDKNVDGSRVFVERFLPPKDLVTYSFAIVYLVGYMFRKEYWNKGLATEFLRAFTKAWWALPRNEVEVELEVDAASVKGKGENDGGDLEVRETLVAYIDANHIGSRRVLEKAGFKEYKRWIEPDSRTIGFLKTTRSSTRTQRYADYQMFIRREGRAELKSWQSPVTIIALFCFETMASDSPSLTTAAFVGILASGWAAGMGTGLSVFSTPTITTGGASGEVMARQWRFMFLRGQAIMPTLGVLNAINYWTVAYRYWSRDLEWRGFVAAGVSTFFIVPYTLTFIMGVNKKLLAASERQDKTLSDASVTSLIKKWGDLNVVRAVVPIIGTGLALWNFCL
ncbi:hypothetical protein CIB48_g2231 [Xylaria polymorpha]|nr:hypothetical protein CIB48_g2231 [Xylaria polymorpha]